MALGYSDIVFGTQTLNIKNMTKVKVAGTAKQKVGGRLILNPVPGRDKTDWQLDMNGQLFDTVATAATSARKVLESYDDQSKRHYDDGLITGSFIITDLRFSDSQDNPLHFEYTISLIEYNQ